MSTMPERVRSFLEESGVKYEVIHHRKDFTPRRSAACAWSASDLAAAGGTTVADLRNRFA